MRSSNHTMKILPILLFTLSLSIFSCGTRSSKDEKSVNGAFAKKKKEKGATIDRIVSSGELIIATISGPDTYFDFQGRDLGLQYALAENFAEGLGVRVRVELVNDTLSLIQKLKSGEADLIALQLPTGYIKSQGMTAAGVNNTDKHTSWAIRKGEADMGEALNDWFSVTTWTQISQQEKRQFRERNTISRKVHAPYISKEKGIISTYDRYFKEVSRYVGWDWKLIAALCYQESGFDPNAVSWAGAKGLMQIMPATARHIGIDESKLFSPIDNIAASSKYIRELQRYFRDIPSREEQMKFVLAAYNGGHGHIRDAQALTRKYGRDPHKWADVSYYVKNLENARYYRDPVVKYGYMIGSETYNYVENILNRWGQYGGRTERFPTVQGAYSTPHYAGSADSHSQPSHKRNRFSRNQRILSADEIVQGD